MAVHVGAITISNKQLGKRRQVFCDGWRMAECLPATISPLAAVTDPALYNDHHQHDLHTEQQNS